MYKARVALPAANLLGLAKMGFGRLRRAVSACTDKPEAPYIEIDYHVEGCPGEPACHCEDYHV